MKTYVEFTNGYKMPLVGLGMWQATDPNELETSVNEALKIGYRHFDTAYVYQNEHLLGKVLNEWLDAGKVKREELFIVTKLPFHGMHKDKVEHFLKLSLTALQLNYVDLYLIHSPIGLEYTTDSALIPMKDGKIMFDKTTDLEAIWKAMENQVDAGKAKSIGISNFTIKQVERIVKIARVHPENIQVELSVQFQQKELREVCKKHKITVCAYGPLGSPGRKAFFDRLGLALPVILEDPVVLQMAKNHKKSAGQILLRFLAQQNIVVIPKSVTPARLTQNFQIFDFELSKDDMLLLEGLNKGEEGRSTNFNQFLPGIEEHPECPFPH